MKKAILTVLVLFILSLSGCAVKTLAGKEHVTDVWEEAPACEYALCAPIPLRLPLSASSDDGLHKLYTQEAGDYEIATDVFTADSLDAALLFLTGRDEQALCPISLDRFPVEQYQYAWTAGTENGTLACSGTLFYDGTHYYAVTIRCAAEQEKVYHEQFAHILANACLQGQDEV